MQQKWSTPKQVASDVISGHQQSEESERTTELQLLMSKCTHLKPLEKQRIPYTNSLHENNHTDNYLRNI